MAQSRLVEVTRHYERNRLSWREQLFGAPPEWAGWRFSVSTPAGEFVVTGGAKSCSVQGPSAATIPLSPSISISTLKRGVAGTVDAAPLRIRRPRYGLRRAGRSVEIIGAGIDLQTEYQGARRYRIRRRQDDFVVYERRGRHTFVNEDASPAEVATALAVETSGVIETSSLLNFITLP